MLIKSNFYFIIFSFSYNIYSTINVRIVRVYKQKQKKNVYSSKEKKNHFNERKIAKIKRKKKKEAYIEQKGNGTLAR